MDCLTLKKSNCKNCYKCIRHCPVKAIRFSGNQAHIIGDECICSSFCLGKCNRVGVTVSVNDDVYVGITKEGFAEFFKEHVLPLVDADRS